MTTLATRKDHKWRLGTKLKIATELDKVPLYFANEPALSLRQLKLKQSMTATLLSSSGWRRTSEEIRVGSTEKYLQFRLKVTEVVEDEEKYVADADVGWNNQEQEQTMTILSLKCANHKDGVELFAAFTAE